MSPRMTVFYQRHWMLNSSSFASIMNWSIERSFIQCNIIAFFIIDFIVTKPWKELLNSPNYIFHTSFIREQWKEPFHLLILECMECQSTLFVLIITQDDHDFFMTSTSLSLSRKHEKYQMSLKGNLKFFLLHILPYGCWTSFSCYHAYMKTLKILSAFFIKSRFHLLEVNVNISLATPQTLLRFHRLPRLYEISKGKISFLSFS